MSLMRRGPPLPILSGALLGALALTNPSWAANDNGYPPGLFERSPEIDGTQSSGPGLKLGVEELRSRLQRIASRVPIAGATRATRGRSA